MDAAALTASTAMTTALRSGFDPAGIDVIAFDVFGTVVDWHGGIAAEASRALPGIDGDAFALAWRAGYQPAMRGVMAAIEAGESGFVRLDDLHLRILDGVLRDFGVAGRLDDAARRDLNRAWHRLPAWPDAVAGLARLKRRYTICPLSNGNIALLAAMAKRAGLPWDCVLSAEVFQAYKPDPRTYRGVASVFDVAPGRVMLAAAHHDDLAAARACGLRTAYIERPLEFGARQVKDVSPEAGNDLHVRDIGGLADLLGC